uniref:Protein phosphatase 1 regulatory subunit n=1 Tax=Cyclopterus lumpus TaxID=8103 RepID=A0A8C3B443_CYCLU
MKMADAKQKRNEQLKRWLGSETDQEPPVLKKKKTKVKFDDGAVFLAACSSGDTEEVLRMLDRGADINYANVDGLTALHQACIDDNVDMVTFLVEHGAGINQPDNEGWIPLHAAASCGYLDIAEYLIAQGASVGVVNSEGETPLDIAEEEAMEELLQNEINRQGVDIEAARKEEERIMLRDARQWLNSGEIQDSRHTKSGGTALHVAAAKGYVEVLKLLIQTGYDVNIKDFDGWTPLHAASHWGKEEACKILVESLCDMDLINKMGQTAFDVADEDVLGNLEELQKKQNLVSRFKKSPLIETTTTGDNNQSLKPVKSKETLLLEPEKIAPRIETLEPEKVDEGEEGKKDESSCSSEDEDDEDSESETEADKSKPSASVSNSTTPAPNSNTASPPTSPTNQVTTPTSPVKKPTQPAGKVSTKVEEERKDESPASWRLGLRKTGSYGALAEITATKEAQREKDTTGVMRSASSPRLSSSLDNKDKEKDKGTRLAYVAPTIPRRLGVTLTDLQEAEKTFDKSRTPKTREEEKEEKEKQDKEKQQEEKKEMEVKEDDYRSKYRSFEEVRFCSELLCSCYNLYNNISCSGLFVLCLGGLLVPLYDCVIGPSPSLQLYEQILAENEKLKAQLRDTDLELADLKLQLEKATQRQERYADRSQLEMEKRERRALERKISEMEEELKMLPDLKADNQRLKDENGALIRVISKLSK